MSLLVNELVEQVRVALDEDSVTDVSDAAVLQALNRAQQKLVRLAGRRYAPLFRQESTLTSDGSRELTIPADAYGLSVHEVDVLRAGVAYKVQPAVLSQLTVHESDASSSTPLWWAQQGNRLKLFPKPASGTQLRVRYQWRPPPLVLAQGRVTTLVSSTSVNLDALGDDLTTSIAQLGAFVNWIDRDTGLVKATLQVASLNATTKLVTFKSASLDRTTVFGQTVATAVPADAALDDYLALASGTCVPSLTADYADYLIQYAVVELKRKSGEPAPEDFAALKELEDDIKSMWAGRAPTSRVGRANPYWGSRLPLIQRYR